MTYQPYDDLPIDKLGLSTRTLTCLRNYNIDTVGMVKDLTDQQLLRMLNLGKVTLREIRSVIAALPEEGILK